MDKKPKKGRIVGICLSHHRQAPKRNIGSGMLKENCGLEGDSHAGSERQISLLASEDAEAACRERHIPTAPGAFAENITTRGVDLGQLRVGGQIRVGEATLQVVGLGKDPSEPHTYAYCGISLLPSKGVFARVITGGRVRMGDSVELETRSEGAEVRRGRRMSRSI
jgi:MOSC domain-containing protein YiiM